MLFLNLFKTKLKFPNMKFLLNNTTRYLKDITSEVPIPEVTTLTIRKHIKQTCPEFRDQYTCFIINCTLCGNERRGKIYINKMTGHFMCSSCKKSGPWDKLQAALSLEKDAKKWVVVANFKDFSALENFKQSVMSIRESTVDLKSLSILEIREVLKKFKLPEVAVSTFNNLDVRIDKEKSSLFFPVEDVDSMVVGYRKIVCSTHEETLVPSIACGGILTLRIPRSKDTAVLVPNISDFLILCNTKINVNVVCLPNSIRSLPQYFLPSLERFKKLVLWMGCDTSSWEAARHFAKKLGEKRSYLVRTCDTQNLPHLDDTQDFKAIISKSQPVYHKSITTFANIRADVLAVLQNNEIVQGIKWTRYPSLSKILKGHRRGELTVITGPTGSGKTTFISDYSLDLAMQGVNTLWGSFEISNSRLAKTMLQQMAGLPLQDNLDLFDQFADKFEKLPIYFMTFHGQQSIKVVMEAVQHATYIYDIAHVIVDNLQFMMGVDDKERFIDRFLKQDAIVAAFRNFATRFNCHVTLVIHPRKEREDDLTASSIFGGAKASQEADNILIIQDKRLISAKGKKFLQVGICKKTSDKRVTWKVKAQFVDFEHGNH